MTTLDDCGWTLNFAVEVYGTLSGQSHRVEKELWYSRPQEYSKETHARLFTISKA